MHEYPITKQIIETAEEYAKKNNAKSVKEINLVVGDYAGYVASSINLYFPLIAENSLCKNAVLNIERIKPKLRCKSCSKEFERKLYSFSCPACGGEGQMTDIGKEFYIKSIVI